MEKKVKGRWKAGRGRCPSSPVDDKSSTTILGTPLTPALRQVGRRSKRQQAGRPQLCRRDNHEAHGPEPDPGCARRWVLSRWSRRRRQCRPAHEPGVQVPQVDVNMSSKKGCIRVYLCSNIYSLTISSACFLLLSQIKVSRRNLLLLKVIP